VLKEDEIPFKEATFGNVSFSREDFHSLSSSTYYILYLDLFNGLVLHEITHYSIQIKSIGPIPFEVLDGGDVHIEETEDNASSHELSSFVPYQPFSWDEGNVVEYVYQNMSSSISSSFFINIESNFTLISYSFRGKCFFLEFQIVEHNIIFFFVQVGI
jgi:hypothetical protein